MASIVAVFDGLADRLETIEDLAVHRTTPGSVNPPAAVLSLESVQFDTSMSRGSDDLMFVARLFTSAASMEAGQNALFSYIDGSGTRSVKQAVEEDVTLGGVAMFAYVVEVRTPALAEYAQAELYVAEFVIHVGVDGLS